MNLRSADLLSPLAASAIRVLTGGIVRTFPSLSDKQQVVFYANHTSHLDFLLIWAALPTHLRAQLRPIASERYWKSSAIRRYVSTHIFNALLIDREMVNRANNPLSRMQSALDGGASLLLFPEGTRSRSGDISDFKSGIHHLAAQNPALCFVPVFLENLFRILPKGEILPLPLIANLYVGLPLTLAPEETRQAFLDRLKKELMNLMPTNKTDR